MNEPSIYAKAIDVIHERGWWDGKSDQPGARCLGFAICNAIPYEVADRASRIDAALETIGTALSCSIPRWNDAPERTVEDVILLLKYADAGELDTWSKLYGPGSEA